MLGELSWEDKLDSGLHFFAGEGVFLIISHELGGLGSDLLEDVVDEGVHDGHGSLGDTGLWVNLLQDSVDVDGESLDSLLVSLHHWLVGLLGGGLSWHFVCFFTF